MSEHGNVRIDFRVGLALATWGQGPEQDWGHMTIRTAGPPSWLERYILQRLPDRRGIGSAVLNPTALGRAVGFGPAKDLWGEEVARALQIAAAGQAPDTFAWPAGIPRAAGPISPETREKEKEI